MRPELRYYQREAVDAVWSHLYTKDGNPLVALPTGTGKSLVVATLAEEAIVKYRAQSLVMLTHRKELIEQNAKQLTRYWPTAPIGIVSAGMGKQEYGRAVTFAGIQSIFRNAEKLGPVNMCVVDECHLVPDKDGTMYRDFFGKLLDINPYMRIVGLTATAYRTGLGALTMGGVFTDICYDLTSRDNFNKLLREGYLAPLVPRETSTELDVSGVAVRSGDFVETALQSAVDKESVTRAAVEETIRLGEQRKKWLVFASGVEHAEHIVSALVERGVPAAVVTGKLESKKRKQVLADFKEGKLRALVNNNVLTTGFDAPELDLIVMLRPTLSTSLHVQMLGRGTRPAPGKVDCLVLDFARNTPRLGPINDPVMPRKKGEKTTTCAPPVKVCGNCGAYNHTRASICCDCGAIFPPPETKLRGQAGTDALIAGLPPTMPIVETWPVTTVGYTVHRKGNNPPHMRVTYLCGLRSVKEAICLQHDGFVKHKAHEWWRKRSHYPVPTTAEEAVGLAHALPKPVSIQVIANKQYPEVVGYAFD